MQVASIDVRSRWFVVLGAVCALVASACFYPGLGGRFIFDDVGNIVKNDAVHIQKLTLENLLYAAYSFRAGHGSRALSMLSFALDYWRGGLDPGVFKATNLLIHAFTTLALAAFLRRLLIFARWTASQAAWGALILALLWAVHPLQVSSVLYVVQRMQALVTLFLVLALWAYMGMRQAQMEGERSSRHACLVVLFWVLGFAGKEDAVLLPAYTLALELTVLGFRAARPGTEKLLRRGYLFMTLAGGIAYLLVVVPHFWSWGSYPSRDFSSYERLLTQGRVLVMYLGQILLPLPRLMPFYYDNFAVSRGLMSPLTTLPAWGLIIGLLVLAWRWRARNPLFALGVMLFFFGHFMTSNVINLELAFEHRNHFPLIGVVLALAGLAVAGWRRFALPRVLAGVLLGGLVVMVGGLTVWRAHSWGDPLRFASSILRAAPDSERAWIVMSSVFVDRSAFKPGADLDRAIVITSEGARVLPNSALLPSNALIYKSINGTVASQDWDLFLSRMRHATMNAQNKGIVWTFIRNANRGIPMDERGVLQTIEISSDRIAFTADQNLQAGAFIYNKTREPGKALSYFQAAVKASPPDDPGVVKLIAQLRELGPQDWAQQLERTRQDQALAVAANARAITD